MDVGKDQLAELLLQMLETEQGGVKVYETRLRCVQNDVLKEEWEKYLAETTQHVEIVTGLIVARQGHGAGAQGWRTPEAAQLVAAECVGKTAIGAARAKKARREML